jgi:hypothetical protein
MSLWTKLRDAVIRPIAGTFANTILPGSGALFTAGLNSPPQSAVYPPYSTAGRVGRLSYAPTMDEYGNPLPVEIGTGVDPWGDMQVARATLPGAGAVGGLVRKGANIVRRAAGKKIPRMGMKKRRRQNPINVKALRRAIRRVRAFKKIEKTVNKLLPKAAAQRRSHSYGHPHSSHHMKG